LLVVVAYALPALLAWTLLGAAVAALQAVLPLAGIALGVAIGYAGYYGLTEVTGLRGLPPPGRAWQVPQTMMIGASPRRRILVWGAILGPGFLTRNPYAGFGLLPLVVAVMPAAGGAVTLAAAAAIGVAHGSARATALLRDVGDLRQARVVAAPGAAVAVATTAAAVALAPTAMTQLDLLLKTVYWRRWDGVALLAAAVTAAVFAARYF
jgi:hypothetical protein